MSHTIFLFYCENKVECFAEKVKRPMLLSIVLCDLTRASTSWKTTLEEAMNSNSQIELQHETTVTH